MLFSSDLILFTDYDYSWETRQKFKRYKLICLFSSFWSVWEQRQKYVETCTQLPANIAVHPIRFFALIKRSSGNRTVLQ